jgi:signal transduction histidine kinase
VAPALESARLHAALVQLSGDFERASQAKSAFLASMSHELRTPLNAILGFAELLLDERSGDYSPDKRAQFLRQIYKSGKHLLALINDILDLSKVEAGRMELILSTFDLATVINSALDTMRPLAAQKSIETNAQLSDAGTLTADEPKVCAWPCETTHPWPNKVPTLNRLI